ncbi:hypothetical protein [Clostridium cadaveris]
MDDNTIVKIRINKIQDINNEELLRYELYSILTAILLSTEEFRSNKEIGPFLNLLNLNFKEYVMKSRTNIISRTLRNIEKADLNTLQLYKKVLKELYTNSKDNEIKEKDIKQNKDKKQNKDNYMSDILNKYSRNKG